jgi:hypothetical protein
MKNMLLLVVLSLIVSSFQEKSVSNNSPQRISVVNESVWEIKEVYVSEVDRNDWQPNLVENEVLTAGGGAIIVKTECGVYDLKIVDTDNNICIVKKIETCGDNKTITITDQSIGSCLSN